MAIRFGPVGAVTRAPVGVLRSLPEKAKAWEDLLLARRTLAAAT